MWGPMLIWCADDVVVPCTPGVTCWDVSLTRTPRDEAVVAGVLDVGGGLGGSMRSKGISVGGAAAGGAGRLVPADADGAGAGGAGRLVPLMRMVQVLVVLGVWCQLMRMVQVVVVLGMGLVLGIGP